MEHRSTLATPGNVELFRKFLNHKNDPDTFYRSLATRAVGDIPIDVTGASVLELGCGRGWDGEALAAAGARVTALEINFDDLTSTPGGEAQRVLADGKHQPFADATFDGVYCSNVLEHCPDHTDLLDDIARVLRPGGWAWISWTNWYSPVGGHEIIPFHYLGPSLGLRARTKLIGAPKINVPFEGLFPVHIGPTLEWLADHPQLDVTDACPRYYPSQRWMLRVPALRELVTWNCQLLLTKRDRA